MSEETLIDYITGKTVVNTGAEANENALKLASFHTGRRAVLPLQQQQDRVRLSLINPAG